MTPSLHTYSTQGSYPFVFQHGLTADIGQVQRLLEGHLDQGIFAIDCPGHGQSVLPPEYVPSFAKYANEIMNALDRQQIDRAVFGGISMGSGIALRIALDFPDRVSGLVLVRPAWLDRPNPDNLLILNRAAELIGKPEGKAIFCSDSEFQSIQSTIPAAANSILGVFSEHQQDVLSFVIRKMVGDRPFKNMNELKTIDQPCLIIANDDDPLHPFEMANQISECIGHSILKKVTSRYLDNDLHSSQVRDHISDFFNEQVNRL